MPALQLENQTFGYWKVLSKNEEVSRAKKQSYWNCECQLCNQIYQVRGSCLTNGKSTKCDSCNRHKVTTNEVNNTYNKLTVIQEQGNKNNRKMWLCKCECGNLIEVSTTDLRTGAVKSCGKCPGKESQGEREIRMLLLAARIPFEQEYSFNNFIYDTGHRPRFDFYIPSRNYVIEYDGKQHFIAQSTGNGWDTIENLEKIQVRDSVKNNFCFDNKIDIIRIPYTVKLSDLTIFDLIPETSKYILRKDE